MSDIMTVQGLNLWYGDHQALHDISMNIPEKSITALIGPSGCGKSTFLKTLNRMNDLIPGVKITGDVRYRDQDIFAPGTDVNELRREIGMVFQKPNPFPMSIYDNIAYGPRTHGIKNRAKLDEIVEKSLRGAAIWDEVKDRLKKNALGLSGGQQQRLCIARALAVEPEVLLMDEPTNGLDIPGKSQFRKFLASGMSDDKTIVISTHQVRDIAKVLDHVLIMDNSRVLLDESTASICSKLFFLESDDRELAATALYTLPSVQGNFLMLPNTEGEESEINLELLFGAVLAEPGKIAEMFHTKTNE